jgi:hypothetical protein
MTPCTPLLHESLKQDLTVWQSLPLVGVQDLGEGEFAELRNCCACATTLAVAVTP